MSRKGSVWGNGITEKVVWHIVRDSAKRAGIQKLAPHDCRRNFACLCHASGGELEQIQFLLGHVSVETTERYLGCNGRLRQAVMTNSGWNRVPVIRIPVFEKPARAADMVVNGQLAIPHLSRKCCLRDLIHSHAPERLTTWHGGQNRSGLKRFASSVSYERRNAIRSGPPVSLSHCDTSCPAAGRGASTKSIDCLLTRSLVRCSLNDRCGTRRARRTSTGYRGVYRTG